MSNLFRVISAAELTTALASGLVPRCASDERAGYVQLNSRADVETAADLYFSPEEAPVALEIRLSDVENMLSFVPPSQGKPFHQARLDCPNILVSWIVAVHPLQAVESSTGTHFKLNLAPSKSLQQTGEA